MPEFADFVPDRRLPELEVQRAKQRPEPGEDPALLDDLSREELLHAVGNIAHDFNNLLGVIIANLDLLGEQPTSAQSSALLGEALEAALRGAEFVGRMLALADRRPFAPEQVVVRDLLERLVKRFDVDDRTGISVSLDLDPSGARVAVDVRLLEASLGKLFNKACAAMPSGGVVIVRSAVLRLDDEASGKRQLPRGDYVQIEIACAGAKPAPTVGPTTGGGGLAEPWTSALRLIGDFIQQSGGQMDAADQTELGTTIRLCLPSVDMSPPIATPVSVEGAKRNRETILVVDDNPSMRRAVVLQLNEFGYRVIEAEDGPAALMTLNSESVDLLFTDVVMPGGLSGYDLARLVLSRWPSMRALITTGYPELEPQGDSVRQAKLRRLPKPYRKSDLARALREVLDG